MLVQIRDTNFLTSSSLTRLPHSKFLLITKIKFYPKNDPNFYSEDQFLNDMLGKTYERSSPSHHQQSFALNRDRINYNKLIFK